MGSGARIWRRSDPLPVGRLAVSIGKFDGVHKGHRRLLSVLSSRAAAAGLESVVVALDPHPLAVLAPGSQPTAINSPSDRLDLLAQLPVDNVKMLNFDQELAAQPAARFLGDLAKKAGMELLVAGLNTRIGRGGAAGITEIGAICRQLGVELVSVPIASGSEELNTRNLRSTLAAGRLDAFGEISGRHHSVGGIVRRGQGRGSQLGFPTANIIPDSALQFPPDGVYAVSALLPGESDLRPAVANLGPRPTFDSHARLLEVHIFEFEGDLAGSPLRVFLERFLRPVQRFEGPDQLVAQIEADSRLASAVERAPRDHYAPWL